MQEGTMAIRFSLAGRQIVPVLAAALIAHGAAVGAPTSTRFTPFIEVGGTALALNGKGTRYRLAFRVYDLALYTTRHVATTEELLTLPGPKKLHFVALRELSGTDLGRLLLRGMTDNTPSLQLNRHVVATTRLIEVFSGKDKMLPGESFSMDFVPGKGTTFYIQGMAQGDPVGDDEFFNLVLRIWFGSSPADPQLRDALLDGGRD
jgi:hypothetical protein